MAWTEERFHEWAEMLHTDSGTAQMNGDAATAATLALAAAVHRVGALLAEQFAVRPSAEGAEVDHGQD